LTTGARSRDNNFVAPDLSPRIREAVNLRLEGHSEEEIAQRLGISPHTVGQYLTLARHPEKYMKYRQTKEHNISPSIDVVNKLLQKDGFVISSMSSIPHFLEVYQHFRRTETASCMEFPYQKKFYGGLAGNRAIYSNRKKFSEFVASKLMQDVFANFVGFRIKKGGKSRSVSGLALSLSGTFHTDKAAVHEIWQALKKRGLRIDNQRNIHVDSAESFFVTLTNAEIVRMNEIMANIDKAITSSGQVYKECKAFTNFFERTARKHKFEPSKASIDHSSSQVKITRNKNSGSAESSS